jgi:FAD/FMN-containing dehydrogenase
MAGSAGAVRVEARAVLTALAAALPDGRMSIDPERLAPHLIDWRHRKQGYADCMVFPRTTAETATIVRVAAEFGAAVVPQGGNTGLVGGSVPEPRSARPTILLSTRALDHIGPPDAAALSITVGAGVVLERLEDVVGALGLRFPLSLGSRGSATIGGLISTNAGGVQVLRHGPMRGLVLGIEAVLADGGILDQLAPLRKDNTGYDLRQLLVGAEGTLGVVTAASLRLVPLPHLLTTAWAALGDAGAALALLERARARFGETVESFEWMGADAIALARADRPMAALPVAAAGTHLLLEVEAAADDVAALLDAAMAAGIVVDATLARSQAQVRAMWAWRDAIPEAERREGVAVKNDVAVPVAALPRFIGAALARLAEAFPDCRPILFGHLGDGNLHFNVRPPAGVAAGPWCDRWQDAVRRLVHDLVVDHGGSISAEHGIGTLKAAELHRLGNPAKIAAMRAIKQALDPAATMNPGKLFAV